MAIQVDDGGVEFDDDKIEFQAKPEKPDSLRAYLFSLGIARNTKQANIIMAAIVVVSILLAIYFLDRDDPNAAPINPEDSLKAGNPSEIDQPVIRQLEDI